MSHRSIEPSVLEELRESGDYEKLAALLTDEWQNIPVYEEESIRYRLLAAEIAGRAGSLYEMEVALAPYLEDVGQVPFGMAARVLLMSATYHYRRNEPSEALHFASQARMIATVRDDEFTVGEAVQMEGQALWSLERWEDAADKFDESI